MNDFTVHQWVKDQANPVLPPGGGPFDVKCCMNPFAVRHGEEYWLYYAGADAKGHRRICLAIADVHDVRQWKRLGPLFDIGKPGSFDATWCVLPCVHRVGDLWHLYYTGRSDLKDVGLQTFWGMGLATSRDGVTWTKHSDDPILSGDGWEKFPTNRAIAGGGRIIELTDERGDKLYRMYYTLPTGTPSKNLLIDQAKRAVIAHSHDGINWFDKRIVMEPRLEADYENAAVIALNIWKTRTRYRAIYAAIGTRFGAYSICEAVSDDGLAWHRGEPGQNLSLPPSGTGWESKMTEYPNVIEENGQLRLFYCGNGYGATGIGTALAPMLD
jgi:predicted GH43/DUF377 family glycosyl hydrolase